MNRRSEMHSPTSMIPVHHYTGGWDFGHFLVALGVVLEVVFVVWEYLDERHDFSRARALTRVAIRGVYPAFTLAQRISRCRVTVKLSKRNSIGHVPQSSPNPLSSEAQPSSCSSSRRGSSRCHTSLTFCSTVLGLGKVGSERCWSKNRTATRFC